METVYTRLWARLNLSERQIIDAQGKSVTIAGTLWLDPSYELMADDVITTETRRTDEYRVYDCSNSTDVMGTVQHREYRLVKQARIDS